MKMHIHSLTLTATHSLTHRQLLTHSVTHTLSYSHSQLLSLTYSLSHTVTHTLAQKKVSVYQQTIDTILP